MLQLHPSCECCDKNLPPAATDAMICTFECTFCRDWRIDSAASAPIAGAIFRRVRSGPPASSPPIRRRPGAFTIRKAAAAP